MKPRRNLSRDCERWILRNSYLLLPPLLPSFLLFPVFDFSFSPTERNLVSPLSGGYCLPSQVKSLSSTIRERIEREREILRILYSYFHFNDSSVLFFSFLPSFPPWYLFNPWSKFPFSALTILARFRSRFPLNFYLESAPRHSIPHIGHD